MHLALVQRSARPALPEARLDQHRVQRDVRAVDGAPQRAQEPRQPAGDVERALLRPLQHVVVVLALALDLRGQAVEPLRAAIGARQEQIADGARDAAVAVVEGMQRDEPQVREAGLDRAQARRCRRSPKPGNASISVGSVSAGGASKCTLRRPTGPETTCIGPSASLRQWPTAILLIPE